MVVGHLRDTCKITLDRYPNASDWCVRLCPQLYVLRIHRRSDPRRFSVSVVSWRVELRGCVTNRAFVETLCNKHVSTLMYGTRA